MNLPCFMIKIVADFQSQSVENVQSLFKIFLSAKDARSCKANRQCLLSGILYVFQDSITFPFVLVPDLES